MIKHHNIKQLVIRNCDFCKKEYAAEVRYVRLNRTLTCGKRCGYQRVGEKISGEKNVDWRGDRISYSGLHIWLKRKFGGPKVCDHCGTTTAPIYDWANVSKEYKRVREDWKRLCRACHHAYDDKSTKIWATRKAAR